MAEVFVFGSNKMGVHGAGAALSARNLYGAELGAGRGRTGNAYAIPTKNRPTHVKRQIDLSEIADSVAVFLEYARQNPGDMFVVSDIGCGLAGYTPEEIGPMFSGYPNNVSFLGKLKQYTGVIVE